MAELSLQINLVHTKAANTRAVERLRYVYQLDVLYKKLREVTFKIEQLESARDDSWKSLELTPEEFWGRREAGLSGKDGR